MSKSLDATPFHAPCVKFVEKTGNTVNSTRKFVLCGSEKCEYRNNNGAVQLQLFSQGQYQGGSGVYFYTRDHLDSIREMTDVNGTVVARYDYDPWGRSTTVIGTNKPDFNFTGLYQHAKSGLDMAVYRFYDPDLGRWLSRDPIGEEGGINLYGYVLNDPLDISDALGLIADVYVTRTSRGMPTVVIVIENGHYVGGYVGNSRDGGLINSDYRLGKQGPADGTYLLKPRTDWHEGDLIHNGAPAITGVGQLTGYPDSGYINPVFFHLGGFPNASTACQTTSERAILQSLENLVHNNLYKGGTTVHFRTLGSNERPAIPVAPFPFIPSR